MSAFEFEQAVLAQIDRLKSVFGAQNFSTDKIVRIKNTLLGLPKEAISTIIDSMIDNHRYAPLPKDFKDARIEWEKRNQDSRNDPYKTIKEQLCALTKEKDECILCWNTGVIDAYHKDIRGNPRRHFICECKAGSLARQLPVNRDLNPWLWYYKYYFLMHSEVVFQKDSVERYECSIDEEEPGKFNLLKDLYEKQYSQ